MDQMKKKKRTLVLKFFLIKPEFPYLQKKDYWHVSLKVDQQGSSKALSVYLHIYVDEPPEAQMKAAVDWNKAKLDSSVKFCQYRKMTKEKNKKTKKKRARLKIWLWWGPHNKPMTLSVHTHRSPIWKWNLNPRGFFDQNRSSGFKPCVNSKRGRLFWHFITCKTTKKTTTTTKITHNWAWTTKRWWKPNFFFFFWFDRDGPW